MLWRFSKDFRFVTDKLQPFTLSFALEKFKWDKKSFNKLRKEIIEKL